MQRDPGASFKVSIRWYPRGAPAICRVHKHARLAQFRVAGTSAAAAQPTHSCPPTRAACPHTRAHTPPLPAPPQVDTVAAQADFAGNASSSCAVRGFDSRANSSVPLWTITIPSCDSSLLYDSDRFIDISDDGSTAAFSAELYIGSGVPVLWVIDAQTGRVRFNVTLPAGSPGGPVMVTETGALVAWTQGDSVAVINGTTGAMRGPAIAMGWNTAAELSDDGSYLAFSGQDTAKIMTWTPSAGT